MSDSLCPQCGVKERERWYKASVKTYRPTCRSCRDANAAAGGRVIDPHAAIEFRLVEGIELDNNGCWLWTKSVGVGGYGSLKYGKEYLAHRAAYLLIRGEIPKGMHIDHLCRVRRCVNPEHMEVVSPAENVRRGYSFASQNSKKTHCPQGHPYDEENTYYNPRKPTGRNCRICLNERQRKRRRRLAREREHLTAEQLAEWLGRTTCSAGHAFNSDNIYVQATRAWRCRVCTRQQKKSRQ